MRFAKPRFRARKIVALVLIPGAVWLIYTVARSKILLDNGRIIGEQSAQFSRDSFVGEPGAPSLTYLALGDSTAAGWGAQSEKATYPYLVAQAAAERGFYVRLVNVAVGGARVGDVAASQLATIGDVKPDLITLTVGANDTTHGTAPDEYRRDWTKIIAALEASRARTILVANTPDMFLAPALPLPLSFATAKRARTQNETLRALIKNSRAQIVDIFEKGKLNARTNPDLYAADWFHPSARGYEIWARLFIEKL